MFRSGAFSLGLHRRDACATGLIATWLEVEYPVVRPGAANNYYYSLDIE